MSEMFDKINRYGKIFNSTNSLGKGLKMKDVAPKGLTPQRVVLACLLGFIVYVGWLEIMEQRFPQPHRVAGLKVHVLAARGGISEEEVWMIGMRALDQSGFRFGDFWIAAQQEQEDDKIAVLVVCVTGAEASACSAKAYPL